MMVQGGYFRDAWNIFDSVLPPHVLTYPYLHTVGDLVDMTHIHAM